MKPIEKNCKICGRKLDNFIDPMSIDCGGDCLACVQLAEQNSGRQRHKWDDDAVCIHCGYDGAEAYHLNKIGRTEKSDEDIYCQR